MLGLSAASLAFGIAGWNLLERGVQREAEHAIGAEQRAISAEVEPLSAELCVVGLVYFELDVTSAVHALRMAVPGQEVFVERLPARLGGALNPASVARALGCEVTLCHPSGLGATDRAVGPSSPIFQSRLRTWAATDDPAISLVVRTDGNRSFVSAADLDLLAASPEAANCTLGPCARPARSGGARATARCSRER